MKHSWREEPDRRRRVCRVCGLTIDDMTYRDNPREPIYQVCSGESGVFVTKQKPAKTDPMRRIDMVDWDQIRREQAELTQRQAELTQRLYGQQRARGWEAQTIRATPPSWYFSATSWEPSDNAQVIEQLFGRQSGNYYIQEREKTRAAIEKQKPRVQAAPDSPRKLDLDGPTELEKNVVLRGGHGRGPLEI